MLVLALFTALSVMLVIAAPLPTYLGTSAADFDLRILFRRTPPTFDAPDHLVPPHEKPGTIARIERHFNTQATDEQRGAQLVSAASPWIPAPHNRESMAISYHAGDTTGSPIIGSLGLIHRDRPGPNINVENVRGSDQEETKAASLKRFRDSPDSSNSGRVKSIGLPKINVENVRDEHQEEMKAANIKRYREHSFSPSDAGRVKSIKVLDDWDRDGGMLEKTTMSFHSASDPTHTNLIGRPVTLNRPMTQQLHKVPPSDRASVGKDIRAFHTKVVADPQHPAALSNYGIVHTGWHDSAPDASEPKHKQVVVGLEEFPEAENKRKPLGDYAVRMGTGPQPAHSDQGSATGGGGPRPASSSSSASSHHGPPGSPNSNSEATSYYSTPGSLHSEVSSYYSPPESPYSEATSQITSDHP